MWILLPLPSRNKNLQNEKKKNQVHEYLANRVLIWGGGFLKTLKTKGSLYVLSLSPSYISTPLWREDEHKGQYWSQQKRVKPNDEIRNNFASQTFKKIKQKSTEEADVLSFYPGFIPFNSTFRHVTQYVVLAVAVWFNSFGNFVIFCHNIPYFW